jgi:2-iminobutanoate/2-iminopropanoate deaminase
MHVISTPDAPPPAGHYSQAIVHAGLIYVAGQLPVDPKTGAVVGAASPALQTEQTLRNVDAILRAGGSGLNHVLSATVYVTSRDFWGEVNATFARLFGEHRPARAIVPVADLKAGCVVEIQVIAAVAGAAAAV